jgi:hypothetical protein
MLWRSDLSRMNCHAQTELFRRRAEQLGESIVDGECFVSGDIQTDDLLRASKCLEGVQRVSDVRKVYLCSIDTENKTRVYTWNGGLGLIERLDGPVERHLERDLIDPHHLERGMPQFSVDDTVHGQSTQC